MSIFPKAREHNIVITESKDELLVYDLNNDRVYCLNNTSRQVWELCNGTNSVDDIGFRIAGSSTKEYRQHLVMMALAQLDEAQLLLEKSPYQRGKGELSRREMMRVLGTTGTIALPFISALTAPQAIEAQSGVCSNPCPFAPGACCAAGSTCCGVLCCPPLFQCCVGFGCFVLAETCPRP